MPAAPVIANNTPLVALWVLGRLDLLADLFAEILIPQAVRDEFLAVDREQRQVTLAAADWLKVTAIADQRRALSFASLDQGEAEVLALAEERQAALIIMDERKGRRYAVRLGFPVTGTIGVLLLAKERGLIPAVVPLLTALHGSGLYLDPELIEQARRLAGEVELEAK